MSFFYYHIYPIVSSWITWFIFIIGSILGSFLNVCIFRIPEKTFWKNTRSCCRYCGKKIPFYLNIPILSYFILRGKTKCCSRPLSIQYPIVEFLTAVMFVFLYWKTPFLYNVNNSIQLDFLNLARFTHATIFCCVLLIATVIDMRHMIIPDVLSIGLIVTSPLVILMHPDLSWKSSLLGIIIGGGSLFIIAWLYYIIRKEIGLGFGDVKLLAGIGGWLGSESILPTIMIGSIIGAIIGIIFIIVAKKKEGMKTAIPYGPFLALGAFLHLGFGAWIQNILFKLHGMI